MLPSLHDWHLVAYEVDCRVRRVTLHAELPSGVDSAARVRITFSDVEGYQFWDDALGNIILQLESVPLASFIAERREELAESFRMNGAPRSWAADLDGAAAELARRGQSAFVLTSTIGLSGWILAGATHVGPESSVP